MPIWITLTPADIKYGFDVGAAWHKCRTQAQSVHKNNRPYNSAVDLLNDQRAATAELAAHLALGTKHWNSAPKTTLGKKEPDLDGWIDVKERTKNHHKLIIQRSDNPSWAYLSVCSEQFPTYCIEAWCWGREGMQARFLADPVGNRQAYFIPVRDFVTSDATVLLDMVRERNCSEGNRLERHDAAIF